MIRQCWRSKKTIGRDECDISVLYSIIRGLPKLNVPSAPASGWGKVPSIHDESIWADVERIRNMRNSCFAHVPKASISDKEFEKLLQTATEIVTRLDSKLTAKVINDLDAVIHDLEMDTNITEKYKHYVEQIQRLEEMEGRLTDLEQGSEKSNQRHDASDQRHDASDQRHAASYQRHDASNQRHDASDQRHDATDQKMQSLERKMAAGNSKADNSNAGLCKHYIFEPQLSRGSRPRCLT